MDLARLDSWIRRARLVTLVGAPGVGKTALALEQARRCAPRVAFCDLTEATDLPQLGAIVARVLDAPALAAQMGAEIVEPIGALLASRGPMLIVLDNFEQALAHAEIVERWVDLAPEARFLVTSRERLGTVRECTMELDPLAIAAPGEESRESDGVRLFVQRARAARRGYVLSEADAPIVAAIVRKLDGLPLAIELAASRMQRLSPAQILAEIGDRFRLVAEAASPPLARGTLWHVVESAFLALGEHERTTLAQCSVFRGGFDAVAAAAVVELPDGAPPVVDLLRTLVDKSLLRLSETRAAPQTDRFGVLLSIREYAAHRLELDGLTAATQARHAGHFVRAGHELSLIASGPRGGSARRRIALETDNLLAVHRRAIAEEPRTPEGLATACRAALTLAASVVLGRLPLCLDVIEAVLAEGERVPLPPGLHGRVLECHAWLSWFSGRVDECATSAARAVLLAEQGGTSRLLGHSLAIQAKARLAGGRVDDARSLVERALVVHRLAEEPRDEGRCLALLADVYAASGDQDGALALCEQALLLHRAVGDDHDEGETLARLGDLALARGSAEEARAFYEEALLRHDGVGNGRASVTTRARLAQCDQERGAHTRAREQLEASARASREVADRTLERDVLEALGACALEQDDFAGAIRALEHARVEHARAPSPREGHVLALLAVAYARSAAGSCAADDVDAALAKIARLDGPLAVAVDVHAASLALAREEGRDARAVLAASSNAAARSFEVRVARRMLERGLAASKTTATSPRLVVGASGRWFRVGEDDRIDLGRRRALRLIVQRLAEARTAAPNTALSADDLVNAGWPGERLVAQTGADRLYTALSTLRKMGLRSVLESRDDGYLFDPRGPFERVDDA